MVKPFASHHCHFSCCPCHHPHPCLPPSLPLPLPSSSPLLLLACQPCHHLHCLAALTLLDACHPDCHHSCCRCHCPCCCSPLTLITIAIALATVTIAISIIIARHPHCHCNCFLCCICLQLPATLIAIAPPFCCWCLCSRHHLPCRLMAVVVAVACQRWQQRRYWQCGNKVNKDNHNNMTTTQQPTQQPTR
jgi:hypothetical protein